VEYDDILSERLDQTDRAKVELNTAVTRQTHATPNCQVLSWGALCFMESLYPPIRLL
jgi:hypothetical protein